MQQGAAPPPPLEAAAGDAPPKQVAQALEQLGQVGRLSADVRLGADLLLEALLLVADKPHHQLSAKCSNLILKEESEMRQHLVDIRNIDGAVVAYAWRRQLAGQNGASAVDRTRYALKLKVLKNRILLGTPKNLPHNNEHKWKGRATANELDRCLSFLLLVPVARHSSSNWCCEEVELVDSTSYSSESEMGQSMFTPNNLCLLAATLPWTTGTDSKTIC